MQLILHTFKLKLKHTFTITHESRNVQPTLIVELREGNFRGFGEATETPYYGVTLEKMKAQLEAVRPLIEKYDLKNPEDFWQYISPYLQDDHPFALCALDIAANDLWGKKSGKKLYEAWGLDISKNPITDYTIGIDTVEKMVEKIKEVPFPLYKIKLGTKEDIKIVKELRKHTNAVFRVDANTAWDVEETIQNAVQLKELGVEFIEQPMKADNWEGMKKVYAESVLPIIADESCIVEDDVARCYGFFHGVNVKLMKCGGLTPAKRMIAHAHKVGLKVMVGCMTESNVGCSAIAQLLPLLDYVDMDGILLVEDHISTGITIDYGKVIYAAENGTGANLIG
ncbi:L-alanine-DL-glutamate epimerase [Pseudarcicella hirudinis]|uniref:Dipeptide epimerase n=1 Tax=Pseudarcicella hirudinis TaxID=1079859 RepID=A0A1I5NVS1_9BACT|nr:dipeptide epimerase [Pseudarcicella hirudinis]SFP25351.1 L-alanine-DL-glutamate epimerase [Pseudarcicella hirudinis]